MPLIRDARRALTLPRKRWRPMSRAILELAIARIRLRDDHKDHLLQSRMVIGEPGAPLGSEQARVIEHVAFAIPRVAPRLPWRTDCMVQALAGERWLRRHGIVSQIVIGVKKNDSGGLEAHAWLETEGAIVTGGDVTDFNPLGD